MLKICHYIPKRLKNVRIS